jgi:predicted enzyme related to lactoylglutathione lyase
MRDPLHGAELRPSIGQGGKLLRCKTSIGSYGFDALVQDTEGTRIGLHSMQ